MSLLITTSFRLSVSLRQVAKYSVNVANTTDTLLFQSNFTKDEQEKILSTLNGSNPDQLSRFNVSQNRIKNLVSWKSKKGPFRTLHDVLEVEGLGEKVLEKICQNIISDKDVFEEKSMKTNNITNKRLKQLITPPLNGNVINNLQSAVGIHLGPIGISWAKLSCRENKLTEWSYEDFSVLPKKMFPADNFELAIKILQRLPSADIYILEGTPTMSPQGAAQPAAISSYTQHLELSSMLIALLNTSPQHNIKFKKVDSNDIQRTENKVYHLRSRVPARLFRTLVGTEKVSALAVVMQLVESHSRSDFSLPCTPITLEQQLRDKYVMDTSANKELLGQALMLVVSFIDLCIYKKSYQLSSSFAE
ncbi:hypothetical protein NQ318_011460 [Aromia moschata]|uniref:Transcription elongation factor, mitochondrial n=1 Tax=Aromia moschata TaxID=1265417 RepID=A0AAV8X3V8_9CUCU|nr:hypothetical protein NQ318_011460 [Aromia moschata]